MKRNIERMRSLVRPGAPIPFAQRWLVLLGMGAILGALWLSSASGEEAAAAVWPGILIFVVLASVALVVAAMVGQNAVSERPESGALAVGQAAAAPVEAEGQGAAASPLRFDDVAGLDDVLADLRELVLYMRDRDRYLALDAKLPKGVLLYGPPGTGKTMLAKVLAAEAGATFLYASGSSFVEKYVGVGAQRIRELFAKARKEAPAIIFIDEIDSIGRSRGQSESSEWDTSLNQLLTELDGFEGSENVMIVAATNRRETLDEALLRPGRLDRQIYIGVPDLPARLEILRVHTRRKPLAADVDLAGIARSTPGLSGAHLAAIANEAALAAARDERSQVERSDFEGAMDRVMAGQTGRPNLLSPEERRLVAYHEAGHALVGWALGKGSIEKITLLSRSQALGYVLQVPDERLLQTRRDLMSRIAMLLGGRAAEQLVAGDFTTGASDDLRKATMIAEKMVTEFGMGERHPHLVIRQERLVFSRSVTTEVKQIIGEGWDRALALITQERAALERLAEALLERESLSRDEVERLLADVSRAA